jgi:predicted nucleic acid-binding protein
VGFYFLDTSALVKQYHLEAGSAQVNTIFDDQNNVMIISELSLVELVSALQRKQNQGEITQQALHDALAQFANTVLHELVVVSFQGELVQEARELVLRHGLRTLDSLQLAFALGLRAMSPIFVCADARLRQAASDEGLSVLDPEATP